MPKPYAEVPMISLLGACGVATLVILSACFLVSCKTSFKTRIVRTVAPIIISSSTEPEVGGDVGLKIIPRLR